MKGHPVLWIPGLDHAGIATQAVVERMLQRTQNITRHDMGRTEFWRLLWQWKAEKATIINQQLKALGATLDWNREYFTIDETHSTAVTETFVRLSERNLLYRARDLVNWSPALRSTISEIEVEDFVIDGKTQLRLPGHDGKVTVGQLIKLAYPIKDSKKELIVATTRLETIFGDVAIAVHPDDERYSKYIGRQVLHPVKETFIPVIADSLVKKDFGTGAVKITPAHDRLDYDIAKRHNLPVISVIDEAGNMTDVCKELKGLSRFVARERLMNELSARGILRGVEDHHRMILPRCSRTYDVIEYLPKEQWFVRCTTMARRAQEIVKNGELRIDSSDGGIHEQLWYDWLENIRDWCVSRQLWWGHRIPAYSVNHGNNNNDGDNDIFSTSSSSKTSWIIARSKEEAYSQARKKYGDTVSIRQDSDVLDTWFSSAIIPFVTLGWPEHTKDMAKYYPLTLMETGHDIFLFWVARMVMLSLEMTQNLPFKEVLLHGILCDANGKKMSKSSGNIILPENIMNGCSFEELNEQARRNHAVGILSADELQRTLRVNAKSYSTGIPDCGVDALRLSLCARNIKNRTISFDVDDCRTSKYFCNKIWQASKYVLLMTKNDEENEKNQQQHGDKEEQYLSNLDQWILSRLSWMVETVNSALAERNFHKAIAAIRQFLHYEFCDLYVEGTKFGFRSGNAAGHFDTLAKCLEVSLRLLAPVTPYLSDDLYTRLAKKGLPGFKSISSLLETSYPMPYEFEHLRDIVLEEKMCELMNVIDVIRSCMANVSKKSNPEVNILTNNIDDYDFYKNNVNLIKGVSRIWNVPILLTESANDGDIYNETRGNDDGIYTTRYTHTNNCSLLIAVTDASMLGQVKKNIARKEKLEKKNQ